MTWWIAYYAEQVRWENDFNFRVFIAELTFKLRGAELPVRSGIGSHLRKERDYG
jgi:hypothetical protein